MSAHPLIDFSPERRSGAQQVKQNSNYIYALIQPLSGSSIFIAWCGGGGSWTRDDHYSISVCYGFVENNNYWFHFLRRLRVMDLVLGGWKWKETKHWNIIRIPYWEEMLQLSRFGIVDMLLSHAKCYPLEMKFWRFSSRSTESSNYTANDRTSASKSHIYVLNSQFRNGSRVLKSQWKEKTINFVTAKQYGEFIYPFPRIEDSRSWYTTRWQLSQKEPE